MKNVKNYQKTDTWFRDRKLERNYRTERNVRGRCVPGFSSRTPRNCKYTSSENHFVHMLVSSGSLLSTTLRINRLSWAETLNTMCNAALEGKG